MDPASAQINGGARSQATPLVRWKDAAVELQGCTYPARRWRCCPLMTPMLQVGGRGMGASTQSFVVALEFQHHPCRRIASPPVGRWRGRWWPRTVSPHDFVRQGNRLCVPFDDDESARWQVSGVQPLSRAACRPLPRRRHQNERSLRSTSNPPKRHRRERPCRPRPTVKGPRFPGQVVRPMQFSSSATGHGVEVGVGDDRFTLLSVATTPRLPGFSGGGW